MRETGCLCIFFCLDHGLPHVTGTPLWLPPTLCSTPTLGFFLLFWMHEHPFFLFTYMWLTYGTPCQARVCWHTYLGKQRISLVVVDILSMHLCLHTWFAYNQKVYTGRFYIWLSSATICEESALCEVWTYILKVSYVDSCSL